LGFFFVQIPLGLKGNYSDPQGVATRGTDSPV